MEEEDVDSVDNDSYYAILNLPRDASEDDVKRSYRQLAQACHPDKIADPAAREQAAASFNRIQEAYEVLSDEEKRMIYDVYGKQGLEAGLELAEVSRKPDELRRDFERFRAKQAEQREEESVAHRGAYIFKVDACELMNPYDRHVDHFPELISVATTNSVQIPMSKTLAASVGCQVAVRNKVGGGSFVCGLKRILTPVDTLELHAAVGLKMFAQAQVTRRLSEQTSASVVASWHPQAGLGLALSSSRQLSGSTEAEWSWQVGPDSVMGMGVTHRGEKLLLSAKLETGAALGVVGKLIWQVTATTSLRASAKFGTMGIELELGGSQQVTEFSSAGCSVLAGLQGIVLKPRFSRGGHVFEVPVLLSQSHQDYRVLAAAYVVPPVVTFVVKYCIFQPLRRRAKIKKALERRLQSVHAVLSKIEEAKNASRVLEPVAKRNLRKEVAKGGLVIISAKYGAPEAIREAEGRESPEDANARTGTANASSPLPENGQRFAARPAADGAESGEDEETIAAAVSAGFAEMPPAWLDVTIPVRFMVKDGSLHFHKGVSKSRLMGFCDVALSDDKVLVIKYLWQTEAYTATLRDKEQASLPNGGHLLPKSSVDAAVIREIAQQQEWLVPDESQI